MYYPQTPDNGNTRSMIDTWLGFNHNPKINRGEFYDMENLSSDAYPLLTPRKIRTNLTNISEDIVGAQSNRGIIQDGETLWVLQGTDLWNLSENIREDLSELMDEDTHTSLQTLLIMGAYLLIWPLQIYINLNDFTDKGVLGSKFICPEGKTITYTPCNIVGSALQNLEVSDTEPENASSGDYWICTNPDKQGLYIYNEYLSTFEAVPTSYIKIEIPGIDLGDYFSEGDAVFMNSTVSDINEGSIIQKIEDGYIVVIGMLTQATVTETTTSAWTLTMERKIPHMDYICACDNRLWGCKYGYDASTRSVINEIYASKLGDFKNFYVFNGLSTDSYSLTIGDLGQFTGCVAFQGYPTFFKENHIYKIYGSAPSSYQLVANSALGVQAGSSRSLAIVGDYLFYKSVSDVCIYDGSTPVSISRPLSREQFYDAVAGGCQNKYYISMENKGAKRFLFVYDTQLGIWEKESTIPVLGFTTSIEGQLYALTLHNVWGLGLEDNSVYTREECLGEEWVDWYAETGEMGYEYVDYKYVSRLSLRAYVPFRSELLIQISYDDRPFEEVGCLRGSDNIGTQSLAFNPFRCDHFRIRLSGHGDCKIYSLAITLDTGSEEDGY